MMNARSRAPACRRRARRARRAATDRRARSAPTGGAPTRRAGVGEDLAVERIARRHGADLRRAACRRVRCTSAIDVKVVTSATPTPLRVAANRASRRPTWDSGWRDESDDVAAEERARLLAHAALRCCSRTSRSRRARRRRARWTTCRAGGAVARCGSRARRGRAAGRDDARLSRRARRDRRSAVGRSVAHDDAVGEADDALRARARARGRA